MGLIGTATRGACWREKARWRIAFFASGNAVSVGGSWVQRVALSYYIWTDTQSPLALSLLGAVLFLPSLLAAPLAGVLSDRHGRLELVAYGKGFAAVLAFLLWLVFETGFESVTTVLGFSLIGGILGAFNQAARLAAAPAIASETMLPRALAANSTATYVGQMIGPIVAGAALTWHGVSGALFVALLTYFPILIFVLRNNKERATAANGFAIGGILREMQQTIGIVRSDAALLKLLAMLFVGGVFGRSVIDMFPSIAGRYNSDLASTIGMVMGSVGAGSLVGSMCFPWIEKRCDCESGVAWSLVFAGTMLALLITFPVYTVALVCGFLAGAGYATSLLFVQQGVFRAVPAKGVGRIIGLYTIVFRVGPALGSVTMGLTGTAVGMSAIMVVFSIALFLSVVIVKCSRVSRWW